MRFRRVAFSALVTVCHALAQNTPTVALTTWHNDMGRTGANPQETILTTSNVNTASFGKLCALPADGQIYAQPLYVPGVNIAGSLHNVLYVVTQNNSVYAWDADSCSPQPLWQVNLGIPVPTTTQIDNVVPRIGILSTPVIDVSRLAIYVVAYTWLAPNATYSLHSLDITTGKDRVGSPVIVAGSVPGTGEGSSGGVLVFNAMQNLQRPALLELNGDIYIGFGSHGDNPPYHGWIFGYDGLSLRRVAMKCLSPNGYGAAVWQGGGSFAADASGDLYVSTGNGDFNLSTGDYGDSVIKMNAAAGLAVTSYFTPSDQTYLMEDDLDLGAGVPLVMPGTPALVAPMVVTNGKDGTVYLLNSANLGAYNATDQSVQEWPVSHRRIGGNVYYNNMLYFWGAGDVLRMYSFQGSSFSPYASGVYAGYFTYENAPAMSLSANGTVSGTAILWAALATSNTDGAGTPSSGILRAFNAATGHEMWDSGMVATDNPGTWAKWNPPTVVNGKVYLGTLDSGVAVYGLSPLTIAATTLPPASQQLSYTQALSAYGGTAPYTFTVSSGTLPTGLSLTAGGLLSGTPSAIASFTFTIKVVDAAFHSVTRQFTMQVNATPPLTITTIALTGGVQFVPYSFSLSASQGIGAETWSVSAGALPAGLSLGSTGVLSGTPSVAGAYTFTLQVSDSGARTGTRQFTLTLGPGTPVSIYTTSIAAASQFIAYSQTIVAAGGVPPYAFSLSSGAFPTGMSFSAGGTLSGTPAVSGSATFTVQGADSTGHTATRQLTLAVSAAPPLVVSPTTLPPAIQGSPYNQTLSQTGAIGAVTWTVSAGTLPAGLAFSAAGVFSGTPTATGNSSFTVQVTDAAARTASQQFTMRVTLVPIISGPVQQQTTSGAAGSTLTAIIAAPAPGDALIAIVGTYSAVSSVTGITGGGVTWQKVQGSTAIYDTEIWVGLNSSGSGTSIAVSVQGSGTVAINISEWKGVAAAVPLLDGTGMSTSGSAATAEPSGSVTLSNPNSLILACVNAAAAVTAAPATGFSALTSVGSLGKHVVTSLASGYYLPGASGAYAAGWTSVSTSYETEIVALLPKKSN